MRILAIQQKWNSPKSKQIEFASSDNEILTENK